MAMMAGGPAVEEENRGLIVCMPSGFPEDAEPPPQSVYRAFKVQNGVA